jgi:hypothetical protein
MSAISFQLSAIGGTRRESPGVVLTAETLKAESDIL